MKKIIIIFFLLLNGKYLFSIENIGVCGKSDIFLRRQHLIDSFVMKLKKSPYTLFIQNQLINNFSLIGIENFVRYNEDVMRDIFIPLLNSENFYVRYKSYYGLGNVIKNSDIKLLIDKYKKETNILIKEMILSSLSKVDDKFFINNFNISVTNFYLKNSLRYIKDIQSRNLIFPDFKFYISKNEPYQYIYYRSGESITNYKEKYTEIYTLEREMPIADKFSPPILKYNKELIFKGKRISYGVGGEIKHVGDDCGWFREGAGVYAIGNGIIRLIHHSPEWGFLIVIEHKLKDGNYICSLYGHLSHYIYRYAGEIVKKGEKIGEIGLSYSVDNGGYGAHLHFAISKGRWLKMRYNMGKNVKVMIGNKIRNIKRVKFINKGIFIEYEGGISLKIYEKDKRFNDYLEWIKGYATTSEANRIWINPQDFLSKYNYK